MSFAVNGKANDMELAATTPPAAYFPARESRQSSPWGNRRRSALTSLMRPFPPGTPFRRCGLRRCYSSATVPESSCLPVRCPAFRSPSARAALPAQTCQLLQFNYPSQCRTKSLRRNEISARTTLLYFNRITAPEFPGFGLQMVDIRGDLGYYCAVCSDKNRYDGACGEIF